jgi:hypothetical protein
MSLNVQTINAKPISDMRRSFQSMKIMKLYAAFVTSKCVKSIQALGFNLRARDSIQQTQSKSPRRLTSTNTNVLDWHGTLKARALQGLRASLKGVACLIAVVIGIAMSMPMAVAPAAQYVPIKSVKQYAKEKTVNPKQWSCLSKLWGKESAWNHLADNPNSTAFGIPQILGMTTTNPVKQIDLGIKYIKHRYDTPCKAWKHHQRKGWY